MECTMKLVGGLSAAFKALLSFENITVHAKHHEHKGTWHHQEHGLLERFAVQLRLHDECFWDAYANVELNAWLLPGHAASETTLDAWFIEEQTYMLTTYWSQFQYVVDGAGQLLYIGAYKGLLQQELIPAWEVEDVLNSYTKSSFSYEGLTLREYAEKVYPVVQSARAAVNGGETNIYHPHVVWNAFEIEKDGTN